MKKIGIKIGLRLFLGFGIIVILILGFGIFTLLMQNRLSEFTEKMHEHPMVVSNAVRDIKIDLLQIHYNIDFIFHEYDNEHIDDIVDDTILLERNIEKNFSLIQDRFLGNMNDVDAAYSTLQRLKPILEDIIYDYGSNNYNNRNEDSLQLLITRLKKEVDTMSDFAKQKSEELYSDAINTASLIFWLTIVFIVLVTTLSIIISALLAKSITEPIFKLNLHVQKLSLGDQEGEITEISNDEIGTLSKNLNNLKQSLNQVIEHAKKIAEGDYSGEIIPRSNKDDLAIALNSMTSSLKNLKGKNEYSDWIKTGQNLINENLRGDMDLTSMANSLVSNLAAYCSASIGAIFSYSEPDEKLKMVASYAYSHRKEINNCIKLGEGVVGQAALEKKIISVSDIPDDYVEISSGLGSSHPKNIIAIPFLFNDKLKGVIELGSFTFWSQRELELFNSIQENIGISFNSSQSRDEMHKLLEQQQVQAKELVAQQQELKAANEELEEKTDSLLLSEEQLKNQQEELKATNEELEEKTENLENQRDEINEKNRELELIKDEIVKKAADLESSSRYKSEFLANMSHELRTPLNSLLILAKDLSENKGKRLSEDDVMSASIIYNSGNELLHLINEILDLAKIESGKMDVNIHKISTSEFKSSIENMFSSLAKDKSLEFSVDVSKDFPSSFFSDNQKLNQIVKNLISNAIKFTAEGAVKVDLISAEKMNTSITNPIAIRVKDSGIGIDKTKLETIFEAFKQADGTTSREYGGTGLGLSISKELSLLIKGEIIVESEPGIGSEFTVIFPSFLEKRIESDSSSTFIKKSISDVVEVADDRESIQEDDQVILIIEDDKSFSEILQNTCRKQGLKVLVAYTGEDGLELCEKYIPSAILLDLKLPGISGLKVLDTLKNNRDTRHIPIHIMSGEDRSTDLFDKGILGFLQKPVDRKQIESMLEKINAVIDKEKKDLLIIEDDDNLRFAIEKLIGNGDVTKTSVSTGLDALKELEKNKYDCVVLDLSLPDIDGFELLNRLDKMDLSHKPPVVIYTGREISYEEEFELRKYASSIIIKGVHSEERLLDETSLFLHRVIKKLPVKKQKMISKVYDDESIFRNKKILVVDDDMRNVFALTKIIEENGMSVVKAANGQKALDVVDNLGNDIDLILMDIMMPVMDGYEAIKEIRKSGKYNSIPILALTAKAMKDDRAKCIEAGANDYMTKPIESGRLLSLMRVWLYK